MREIPHTVWPEHIIGAHSRRDPIKVVILLTEQDARDLADCFDYRDGFRQELEDILEDIQHCRETDLE